MMTSRRLPPVRGPGERGAVRLFRVRRRGHTIIELGKRPEATEKSLQVLMEQHLLALFDVHLLASEYRIGVRHEGRIDTLGIDRDGIPVVIEYKRHMSATLISQGLFYLDWLDDHRAEFRLLVQDRLGASFASAIRWGDPRLICVAAVFHRYDVRAVHQMRRRIELIQFSWFGDDLLAIFTRFPPSD